MRRLRAKAGHAAGPPFPGVVPFRLSYPRHCEKRSEEAIICSMGVDTCVWSGMTSFSVGTREGTVQVHHEATKPRRCLDAERSHIRGTRLRESASASCLRAFVVKSLTPKRTALALQHRGTVCAPAQPMRHTIRAASPLSVRPPPRQPDQPERLPAHPVHPGCVRAFPATPAASRSSARRRSG